MQLASRGGSRSYSYRYRYVARRRASANTASVDYVDYDVPVRYVRLVAFVDVASMYRYRYIPVPN